ncbi:MAG: ABC transporter ATP-binding protein [Nitrospirae bacterium]|nr:ABC transporter ATP-binding protein [Nitrospirota bacterium]
MGILIETQNIKKSFKTEAGEIQVLKGINLKVNEGEMVSIVGASGVGKSTLLHIIGALDNPTYGRVLYNDRDIFSMNSNSLASFRNTEIGFVFQFHHLLPEFTAFENVLMPALINRSIKNNGRIKNIDIYKKADEIISQLGLSGRKNHKPGELSGGEQQRVAVARALMLEPKVVLADEPTGNLDTATGEEIFKIFMELNKERGITFVIVTHNESLSKRCHRIFKMQDGLLFEK